MFDGSATPVPEQSPERAAPVRQNVKVNLHQLGGRGGEITLPLDLVLQVNAAPFTPPMVWPRVLHRPLPEPEDVDRITFIRSVDAEGVVTLGISGAGANPRLAHDVLSAYASLYDSHRALDVLLDALHPFSMEIRASYGLKLGEALDWTQVIAWVANRIGAR